MIVGPDARDGQDRVGVAVGFRPHPREADAALRVGGGGQRRGQQGLLPRYVGQVVGRHVERDAVPFGIYRGPILGGVGGDAARGILGGAQDDDPLAGAGQQGGGVQSIDAAGGQHQRIVLRLVLIGRKDVGRHLLAPGRIERNPHRGAEEIVPPPPLLVGSQILATHPVVVTIIRLGGDNRPGHPTHPPVLPCHHPPMSQTDQHHQRPRLQSHQKERRRQAQHLPSNAIPLHHEQHNNRRGGREGRIASPNGGHFTSGILPLQGSNRPLNLRVAIYERSERTIALVEQSGELGGVDVDLPFGRLCKVLQMGGEDVVGQIGQLGWRGVQKGSGGSRWWGQVGVQPLLLLGFCGVLILFSIFGVVNVDVVQIVLVILILRVYALQPADLPLPPPPLHDRRHLLIVLHHQFRMALQLFLRDGNNGGKVHAGHNVGLDLTDDEFGGSVLGGYGAAEGLGGTPEAAGRLAHPHLDFKWLVLWLAGRGEWHEMCSFFQLRKQG